MYVLHSVDLGYGWTVEISLNCTHILQIGEDSLVRLRHNFSKIILSYEEVG